MNTLNFFANAADGTTTNVTISYTSNLTGPAVWLSPLNNSVTQIDSRTKLEDVLPTAKALATEFRGSPKAFMEWLDTP